MPAELAWLFATRPVFLFPELLPCASLDPALYCPRRTAAFTAAEDCLLVLGLRNMEGSCDPTKLVSHFLLRKSVVQVRRRILQCCRPGHPDNIVKAFRYHRVVWPMLVVCRGAVGAERRPPVEREESALPVWLQRSLPVIYPTIKKYNSATPEAPPPCKSAAARHSHLTFLRSASHTNFPPGTKYPPRLPKNLDFRRMGFLQLNQPLPLPPPDSAPLQRPLLSHPQAETIDTSAVSMTTREQISHHNKTLNSLRRRGRSSKDSLIPPPPDGPAPSSEEILERDDVLGTNQEELEEESEIVLALSESSPSSAGSVRGGSEEAESEEAESEEAESEEAESEEAESESEEEVTSTLSRTAEEEEQLGKLLDSEAPDFLSDSLSRLLSSWPRLLQELAAFLSPGQVGRWDLQTDQKLFEHSRWFLQRLGRSLGEDSSLYQQVVSVLQGSPAPVPEDVEKISSFLKTHPNLHQEFWEFFQQLHTQLSPMATSSDSTVTDVNEERDEDETPDDSETGSDEEEGEESEGAVCNKIHSMTTSAENAVVWTREEDRAILTTCKLKGANQKIFRQVSAQLGNKTAQQVRGRLRHLMNLFHVQKSTSCSSECQPIST